MNDVAPTDWRNLREFAAVDLTKSFVLSWNAESGTLLIDVDVFLTPEHAFYEQPRPAEKVCIRPAIIEFPYCQLLRLNEGEAGSVVEVAATIEHGAIKGLCRLEDGRYEIRGDFGTVFIEAERPLLKLKGP